MNEQVKKRATIIDKHVSAMLDALRAAGFDPLGMAGGIVLGDATSTANSQCHTFYQIAGDVRPAGGEHISEREFVDGFVGDVARTLFLTTSPEVSASLGFVEKKR